LKGRDYFKDLKLQRLLNMARESNMVGQAEKDLWEEKRLTEADEKLTQMFTHASIPWSIAFEFC
jgi:hypothetical protein